MRPDLQAQPQTYQGRRCWLVTDPLALKYYRFEEEEYFLLTALDNQTSLEQLVARFQQRFAPQRLHPQDLQQLLGQLHRSGLVLSERSGQGQQLFERRCKTRRQQWWQQLANPLAIRFRGIDPERILRWLEPWTAWLFSPAAFFAAAILLFVASAIILTNFEQFLSRLPEMHDFFAGRNWLGLALVLGLTKVCHELGHALTCRRFGGQCPELGVMLLVFTPCLYANVSDSWRIPEKWKRMAISFAGIYVELLLAALATLVWWSSQPGLVNQLALNVMFVCSVGTLLFNANPLMKYDGYYLLADWLEIPNLKQRASGLVSRALSHWLLGLPGRPDPWLSNSRRWLLWCYALAALVYRWLMTVGILWFLYRLLEPWGLQIIGQGLAAIVLISLVATPVRRLFHFFSIPGRWNLMNRTRLAVTSAACLLFAAGLLWLPLPHHIRCPFYLQPLDGRQLFVDTPGIVVEVLAQPGAQVEAGQPLVRLQALELTAELVRLQGELAAAEAQLKIAQTWSSSDEAIAEQLPAARAAAEAAERQFARKQLEAAQLTIFAPTQGVLLPAQPKVSHAASSSRLVQWEGQPLRPGKQGFRLESQTSLGTIAPATGNYEAVLLVSQEETEPLVAGQAVRLALHTAPGSVLTARTGQLSAQPIESIPPALSVKFGGEIPTQTDANRCEQPLSPRFQLASVLTTEHSGALPGGTGVAYIHVGYRSLGARLWRWTLQTFHFEL